MNTRQDSRSRPAPAPRLTGLVLLAVCGVAAAQHADRDFIPSSDADRVIVRYDAYRTPDQDKARPDADRDIPPDRDVARPADRDDAPRIINQCRDGAWTGRPPVPDYLAQVHCAADGATVLITVGGVWNDTCTPRNPRVRVEDTTIFIQLDGRPPAKDACGDALTPWCYTFAFGPLADGDYKVVTTILPDDPVGRGTVQVRCQASSCYANCDGSALEPALNVEDFACFINKFVEAQGLPRADQINHYANCDRSTTDPVLNVEDFACFINAFAQGCP
jgi:hypothetical protein